MSDSVKDSGQFPSLRNLQFSPLKEQEEQYVLLWDPTGLTTEKLIVPLNYFYLLQFFDGEHSLEQIGAEYLSKFGEFLLPDRLQKLVADLEAKLFLEGERAEAATHAAITAYRSSTSRPAVFAGRSYDSDGEKLQRQLEGFFTSKEGPDFRPSVNKGKKIKGIVAPHYDLQQGGPIYAWAYKELKEAEAPDLFVVLGTCHTGLNNGFALTDKDFQTPLGTVSVDHAFLERLRQAGGSVFFEEDFSHRNEHSIEFQLPFLQYSVGEKQPFTIVPVLCAFAPDSLVDPESQALSDKVELFIRSMKTALAESGREACFIASVELAHIGMRYGDNKPPTDYSFHKCMQADLEMLKHVENLDAESFAKFIRNERNARRISGFAVIYTLLRLIQADKGEVLRYDRGVTDQFNSTVTYASMAFY
ncbi:MAG: AmmeMemoRadiSam system protein B [Nitrospiraceae bacterium]|nr:AmmeMemoRadiSam system protein B [Nitrospiraceae bacterium]